MDPTSKILSLTDQERRATEPGYLNHKIYIKAEDFPVGSVKLADEVKRLRAEQNKKNAAWRSRSAYAAVLTRAVTDPEMIAMRNGTLGPGSSALLSGPGVTPITPTVAMPSAPKEIAPVIPPLPKYSSECTLKLDPGTGNTVLLVASSKAGKTTLQMNLYRKYFKKSIAIMFAHSTQLKIYREKNLIVTDHFEPDIVEIMRKLNRFSNNKFAFTCLFDDQLNVKNDTIQDLFLSLRNSNISSVISLQYVNLMSKACRGNVNTVLGGAMNSDENVLVFIKCYLLSWMHSVGVKTDPAMIDYYRRLTSDHGFINIHPASGSVTFCRLKL